MTDIEDISEKIQRQLKTLTDIEPLKVANGYSIPTLISVVEKIYEKDKELLSKEEQYFKNYLNLVSFVFAGVKVYVAEKGPLEKTFSKSFLSELFDLLNEGDTKDE